MLSYYYSYYIELLCLFIFFGDWKVHCAPAPLTDGGCGADARGGPRRAAELPRGGSEAARALRTGGPRVPSSRGSTGNGFVSTPQT